MKVIKERSDSRIIPADKDDSSISQINELHLLKASKTKICSRFEEYFMRSSHYTQLTHLSTYHKADALRSNSFHSSNTRVLHKIGLSPLKQLYNRKSLEIFKKKNKDLENFYSPTKHNSMIDSVISDNLSGNKSLLGNDLNPLGFSTPPIELEQVCSGEEPQHCKSFLNINISLQQFSADQHTNSSSAKQFNQLYNKIDTQSNLVFQKSTLVNEKINHKVFSHLQNNFLGFLASQKTTANLIQLSKSLTKHQLIRLLSSVDLINACMQAEYNNLIEYMRCVCSADKELQDVVLSRFDNTNIWRDLISNKYAKNVVEYFINHFLDNFEYKRSKLYDLIECSLIEFSKKNYATFVVQSYIMKEKSQKALQIMIENLMSIVACRNGVFVIIASLKSYSGKSLQTLINRIVNVSDILSKNAYSSTLIEYMLVNHENAASLFIKSKSNSFLGKPLLLIARYYRRQLWKLYNAEAFRFCRRSIKARANRNTFFTD